MKLNGKELDEYKDVESLADVMEATLDGLASKLQKLALMTQENKRLPSQVVLGTVSAYLNAVTKINHVYATRYSESITSIKDHFNSPALKSMGEL